MKGFEIKINGEKIIAAVENGLVMISINNAGSMSVSGMDNNLFRHNKWYDSKLNLGDKIKITALEVEESSPCETEPMDRQEMLSKYHSLKKNLTEEGLLK